MHIVALGVIASLATVATAAPASPVEVAPRSFESGGMTCYYTCQTTIYDNSGTGTYVYDSTQSGGGLCHYSNVAPTDPAYAGYYRYCQFDPTTGYLTGGSVHCPSNALGPTCGVEPVGGFRKKRDALPADPAREAIQARQYNPKRAVAQAEAVKE